MYTKEFYNLANCNSAGRSLVHTSVAFYAASAFATLTEYF